ncbi:MAG: hypothetical protein GY765_26850 [bacterium]|nr:hypothetical protein [bacterium]
MTTDIISEIKKIKRFIEDVEGTSLASIKSHLPDYVLNKEHTKKMIRELDKSMESAPRNAVDRYKKILLWLRDEKILVYPKDIDLLRLQLIKFWSEEEKYPYFLVNKKDNTVAEDNTVAVEIVSTGDFKSEEAALNNNNAVSLIVQCMFIVFSKDGNGDEDVFYTLHDRSYSGAKDAASKYALVSGRLSTDDLDGNNRIACKSLYRNALVRELQEIEELNLPGDKAEEFAAGAVYIGSFTETGPSQKGDSGKVGSVMSCLFGIGITPEQYNELNNRGPYLLPVKCEEYSKLRTLDLVGDILYKNSCSRCNVDYKEKNVFAVKNCIIRGIDAAQKNIEAKMAAKEKGKETEAATNTTPPHGKTLNYADTPFYKNRIRCNNNSTIIAVDTSNYSLLERDVMLEIRDQLQRFLFSFFPIPKPAEAGKYSSHIQTTGDGYIIVLSDNELQRKSAYKLTKESIDKFKREEAPEEEVVKGLRQLENHEYLSRAKFLADLKIAISDHLPKYKLHIMKYARSYQKKPYVALISYFFALYLKLKIQNLVDWSKDWKDDNPVTQDGSPVTQGGNPVTRNPYEKLDIRIGLHADNMEKRVSLEETYFPGDGIVNAVRILDFGRQGQILCSQNFAVQLLTEIEELNIQYYDGSYDAVEINCPRETDNSEKKESSRDSVSIKSICFHKEGSRPEHDHIDLWQKDHDLRVLLKRLELPPDVIRIISDRQTHIPGYFKDKGLTLNDFGFLADKHGIRHRIFNLGIFPDDTKKNREYGERERPITKIPIVLRTRKTTSRETDNLLNSFRDARHITIYGYSNIRLLKGIYNKLKENPQKAGSGGGKCFPHLTDLKIVFYSFDQIRHINEEKPMAFARLWWLVGFFYANKIAHLIGARVSVEIKINEVRYGFNVLKVIYRNESDANTPKDHIRFTIPLPGSSFELSPVFIINKGEPLYHYYLNICEKYIEQGKKENSNINSIEEFDFTETKPELKKFFNSKLLRKKYKDIDAFINSLENPATADGIPPDGAENKRKSKAEDIEALLKQFVQSKRKKGDRGFDHKFYEDVAKEIQKEHADTLYICQLLYCLEELMVQERSMVNINKKKAFSRLQRRKYDFLELGDRYEVFIDKFKWKRGVN